MPVFHVLTNGTNHLVCIDDPASRVYEVLDHNSRRQHSIERVNGAPGDLERHFASAVGTVAVAQSELDVGQCYPRIHRPPLWLPTADYTREWRNSAQAVRTLFASLREVLRVVEPSAANLGAYGHELRQLLILGCNEVESSCRAVLKANGHGGDEKRWTMREYVKLLPLMRLDEWEVRLPHYPDLPPFKPFGSWNCVEPTQSLVWYHEHNAVKHDRESSFEKATLGNALNALGASLVLVVAQFGVFGRVGMGPEATDIVVTVQPTWALSEYYVRPRSDLSPPDDWVATTHPALA